MFLWKLIALFIFLSSNCVKCKDRDIIYLRDHFITNLLEENRENFSLELTDEIEKSIDLKINAFLNEINHKPKVRKRRETSNLLLNEKPTDINVLKGFEQRGIVPINFPQDICMFKIKGKSFAVGLNYGKSVQSDALNTLMIFKRENGTFHKVREYKSKFLSKIDCDAVSDVGYVAILNFIDFQMTPDELLKSGSFVYRVNYDETSDTVNIEKLQIFAEPNQIGVNLSSRDNDLFLVYSYQTESTTPLEKCTVFKLSANTFNPIDTLPCQNARVLEFFTISHNFMLLIGNYRENNGTTNAFSSIMRYDLTQRRFIEHQKIYTNAITVGKYFFLDHQDQRQHFLFIGNSFEVGEYGAINYDVLSIIYKWVDGYFIPLQTINVTQVEAVSAILGKNNEFNLLISSSENEVQIFNYDGWKFQESPLDFTGRVFDTGVVSIRSYNNIIEDTSTIVISNANSYGNQWNIYTPVYVKRTDSTQLKENILNWCSQTFAKLDEFNVDEADEMLKSAINMIDPSNDRVNFSANVFIEKSKINSIQATQLKRRNSMFNETSIEKINELAQRASRLQKNVNKLKEKIDFTKITSRSRRQAPQQVTTDDDDPLIHTLIVDKFLDVKKINGKPIEDILYQANRRNTKIKNIVANEIAIKGEMFVNNHVDGIEMSPDNILVNGEQDLRPMGIDSLSARSIDTLKVNQQDFDEFFKLLRLKVDRKIPNMIQQLDVDVLNVKELFNGENITEIFVNSLKTIGSQFVNSGANIQNLYANGIIFESTLEMISKVPVEHLINIKNNKPVRILQDIQFEQVVNVNELFVDERINNINVHNGDLQVMRKRGLTEQIVVGEKYFNYVNLMEPIKLNGKIKSKTLEKMNPVATIDRNLVLDGDYIIKGPVTIMRMLNTTNDILTTDDKYSFKKLVEQGLNLYTTSASSNKFNFKNILEVRNNFDAHAVNGKVVNTFVKTDFNAEQIVGGTKTFFSSLFVGHGSVQADVINDVDLRKLNQTTLKRSHPVAQFVDGNVQFEEIRVDQIISQIVNVGTKDSNLILNTLKPQNVKEMSVNNFKVKTIKATTVEQSIGSTIFGTDLNFLIDDSVSSDNFYESPIAMKNFGQVKVNHLEFADGNEWKSIISNFNNAIVEELNVTDSHVFENKMRIGNLQVHGTINGVKYEDMIQNWLRIEGDQVFTEPQTFKALQVDNNVVVTTGLINNVKIGNLIEDSIWIDQRMDLNVVEIDGVMNVKGQTTSPLINGKPFTENIVLNNTAAVQKLRKIKVKDSARIKDLRFNKILDIALGGFFNLFNGHDDDVSLVVNGKLYLDNANILSLNGWNVKDLYSNVWLRDRDTTLSGDFISFEGEVNMESELYSDTLNGKDLDEAGTKYLSRTVDQFIHGNLNILGTLIAEKSFNTGKIIIPKYIKINENTLLNISHFEANVLRQYKDQQITGNWKINRLIINGNFNGLINGINLQTDVLHKGNQERAIVTGYKKFKAIETININTRYLNEIDIVDWIENSVKLNTTNGQTINGHLVFKQPISIHNLQVHGNINGIDIRPEIVLTKSGDQIIGGDVTINTMPPIHDDDSIGQNDFKQLLFEKLELQSGATINSRNWYEFYANAFTNNSTIINSKQIVFENVLKMESVLTDKSVYGVDMREFLRESSTNKKLMKFKSNMEYLTEIGDELMRSLTDDVVEMSHFEHHQTIAGQKVQNAVLFSYKNERVTEYALGIHSRMDDVEMIKFYRWNPQDTQFVLDSSITELSYKLELYQLSQMERIVYNGSDCLFLELIDVKEDISYSQLLLQYDVGRKTFLPATSMRSQSSMKLFTWGDGSMPCYGASQQSFENIVVHCMNKYGGLQQQVMNTRPIKHIWSENNIIVFANDQDKVEVRYEGKEYSLPAVLKPASFASIKYNKKLYLAVRSDRSDETVHRGSINIFVSSLPDVKFEHLQKITLNMPTTVKFSKVPSGDLMLYILTKDPTKALNIYSYSGSSNFVEIVSEATIIPEAGDLDVIQVNGKTEVLAVASNDNVFILQSTLVQY